VILASFEILNVTVSDPFRKAFQVGAEKVSYAIGIFQGFDIDGQRRENL
jgi:hypothetical protein